MKEFKFVRIDGASNSPTHGHLFMYFGKRKVRFRNVFKQFGAINIPFRGE